MRTPPAPAPEPDTKDWTWVLDRPCPDCGFVAADVDLADVGPWVRANAEVWVAVLAGPGAAVRPAPGVWSTTEYAAHVRDVHRVFAERLRLILEHEDPSFADWDQDATALAERYDVQDAATVAVDLMTAATAVAGAYDGVTPEDRDRCGRRSNGSVFTVESIARYHLHDVFHHLWDVRPAVTVAAYDAAAGAYAAASPPPTEVLRTGYASLLDRVGPGARVLEVGSGAGRDALELETRGLRVRRTDVAPGFVERLRAAGHGADVLDPLTDDLLVPGEGPYDAVWANASLLHVTRADLPQVLSRLAGATRAGGVLRLSLKEGDGEAWSTHGSIATPRMFVYWREAPLRSVLVGSGWDVVEADGSEGQRGERWLTVLAVRR